MSQQIPRELAPAKAPTVQSIRNLYEWRIKLERESAAGPWDEWDGALVDQWLEDVRAQIRAAEMALSIELSRLQGDAL